MFECVGGVESGRLNRYRFVPPCWTETDTYQMFGGMSCSNEWCGWVVGCSNVAGFVYVTSVDMIRWDYTPFGLVDSNTLLLSTSLSFENVDHCVRPSVVS